MCGIGGFAGEGLSHDELTSTIKLVCKNLHHRGPDDHGYFVSTGIALGAARLAIRDPISGKQPMTRNNIWIVFNGEIYNADPLRDKIQINRWKTRSDTEVILEGYLQYGADIFKELSGMFACAIWDGHKKTLFLARDRWGEKPLYYSNHPNSIVFSSDISGLKPWKHLTWQTNLSDILAFLKNSYIPTPHSGWEGIFKLKPGCYLKWNNGAAKLHRYHFPQIRIKHQNANDLKVLIESSVKKCAVSDKPVGAFLSGGIDSSTVVASLQKEVPKFPVYSIVWEDKNYSEKKYSSFLCEKLGLTHHLVTCQPSFMIEHFDTIVALYGELFGDESMIPTFCLARRAKEDVDVVLTGDGADEFFHGYERYFSDCPAAYYSDVFSAMTSKTRNLILSKELQALDPTTPLSFEEEWGIRNEDRLRARSLEDIHSYLPDDILTKVDRATMGVGLEARAPFLTPEITNFALNTPIDPKRSKYILREAVKEIIPPLILNRKKQGFGVPLNRWFSGELKQWMIDRILYGTLPNLAWFLKEGLERLCKNPGDYPRAIFNLLVLESWHRKNIY